MEAKAIARHVRVTPRKARRMVDLIRGKKATEAVTILKFAPQAAALPVRKTLESAIANISALKGEKETEALFRQKASARRDAVNRYLWDDENGIYRDYDWRREQLALFSAAAIVPLYVGMANHEQADRLANAVRSRLLTPGGILASEYETGEQWDKPNGWAPLQWMAIQGFKMYGDDLLGDEIARSWLKTVNQFYLEQHKLIEKYHIADGVPREGGGGEYPLQDGFGWTNGVVRRLIGLYGEP